MLRIHKTQDLCGDLAERRKTDVLCALVKKTRFLMVGDCFARLRSTVLSGAEDDVRYQPATGTHPHPPPPRVPVVCELVG